MKKLMAFLFMCFSVNSACAAIYHVIFTGTVENVFPPTPMQNAVVLE